MSRAADVIVRPYAPADRPIVRRICADTGFLGNPIDPVFEDRELFADYLTDYYLSLEPDSAWVCELRGEVRGYLLGCGRPWLKPAYQLFANVGVAARALYRAARYPYGEASRAFMRWVVWHGWRETPTTPFHTPHFHLNVLPDARSVRGTRCMIESFLAHLMARGHRRVYGQMVTFERRRTQALFERYGFRVADRVPISKYQASTTERVFLSTVIKDLTSRAAPRS